jgi:XisH protein
MAKDIYHEIVRIALEKDEWSITADPYKLLMTNRRPLEVDLAAEKMIAAEKGATKIAVEIKSFLSDSFMRDWYTAVGQYSTYDRLIAKREPGRQLFLAIPEAVYLDAIKDDKDIWGLCVELNVRLIIFDVLTKTIVEWIN